MKLPIYQVDAFTDRPFAGNPAAIVPLDSWLPDELMLSIAVENNLAETAFFVRSGDKFHIRWFTPAAEVPLCGHATLASSYVIFNELGFEAEEIVFTTEKVGELRVTREGDKLVLDFPAYEMSDVEPVGRLTTAEFPPTRYLESQGNMLFLVLDSQETVAQLQPDFAKINELPYQEIIVTAKGEDCDFASRMFAPKLGIPEDPVTGAIHCSLVPFWAAQLGKTELLARQVSPRGGELHCRLEGDRVKIAGNAVLFLKGEIYVEAGKSAAA